VFVSFDHPFLPVPPGYPLAFRAPRSPGREDGVVGPGFSLGLGWGENTTLRKRVGGLVEHLAHRVIKFAFKSFV